MGVEHAATQGNWTEFCSVWRAQLITCAVLLTIYFKYRSAPQRGQMPGPTTWPLVGNLLQLGHKPHVTLTEMTSTYGDVFRIRLGSWDAVVVNGYEYVRQALVKQSDDFAGRPDFPSFRHYAGGKSISFQSYTPQLRLHRRLTRRALRVFMQDDTCPVEDIVRREAMSLVEQWTGKGCCTVNPTPDITMAVGSVLYAFCFGSDRSLKDDKEYTALLSASNPSTELFGAGNQVDLMPWLRIVTSRAEHRANLHRMDTFVRLNDKKKREHLDSYDQNYSRDLMDTLIEASRRTEEHQDFTESPTTSTSDCLLNTTIELISAGSETSTATLSWLILYMAAYPQVQTKLQAEIDDVIGGAASPSFADRHLLPFTEACIHEVMRLASIVPFALPHSTIRDTELAGYSIPRDTLVFINLWSVCKDPRLWRNPHQFRPDRFLYTAPDGTTILNKAKAEMYMPFGAGRRRCIGETVGRMQVFTFFVTVMQQCVCKPIEGVPLDLEPVFGDIMKPKPYRIQVLRRH